MSDAKSETRHLIEQAARELELENLEVLASLNEPGFYIVVWGTPMKSVVKIPMAADYKGIISTLRAKDNTT